MRLKNRLLGLSLQTISRGSKRPWMNRDYQSWLIAKMKHQSFRKNIRVKMPGYPYKKRQSMSSTWRCVRIWIKIRTIKFIIWKEWEEMWMILLCLQETRFNPDSFKYINQERKSILRMRAHGLSIWSSYKMIKLTKQCISTFTKISKSGSHQV